MCAKHSAEVLCLGCSVPVCSECLAGLCGVEKPCLPRSLGERLYVGYMDTVIAALRPRWIEVAAATPVWTSMVVYYIEDACGQLLEEKHFAPQHRTAVRGNVGSFLLDWRTILSHMQAQVEAPQADDLLRAQSFFFLMHTFQIFVKI